MRKTLYLLSFIVACSILLATPIAAAKPTLAEFTARCSFVASADTVPAELIGDSCILIVRAILKEGGHWQGIGIFMDTTSGLRAVLRITVGEREGEGGTWILSGGYGDFGGGATVWQNNVKIAENIVFALALQTAPHGYYLELYISGEFTAYHWATYTGLISYTES